MNYKETCSFLYNSLPAFQRIGKAAYKADLERTLAIDTYFEHPHKKFNSIHIAGTNGKGSVSHIIASVLQEAGFKTGLYTSPHISDFRERIKINGIEISEQEVIDFVVNHKKIIEDLKPSFFEMTVAMCFDYFARKKVDIAVVETGLGGRLDSTNILQPLISVITNVSLEHTEFLGDTLKKIAKEKAGIIKKNTQFIVGEMQTDVYDVFANKAKEMNAPLHLADADYNYEYSTLSFDALRQKYFRSFCYQTNKGKSYCITSDLTGNYQRKNLITAKKTIETVKQFFDKEITEKNLVDGAKQVYKNTGLKGRWQTLSYNPLIVADTAHNAAGISEVINQINQMPFKKLHIVFGVVKEKNLTNIFELMPKSSENIIYYFTKSSVERSMPVNDLVVEAHKHNIYGSSYANSLEAFKAARQKAETNDMVFVGGSTFVVADVLSSILYGKQQSI